MAKALKTVGMVVAVAAIAATGIGLAIGGAAAAAGAAAGSATFLGVAGTTWASIGVWAGLASGVIGVVGALAFKPKFANSTGNPLRFQANPQSGLPYAIGRTVNHGVMVHGATGNTAGYDKQDILSFIVMLSVGGAIFGIESFKADKELVTFDAAGGAIGNLYSWMGQKVHLGGPQSAGISLSISSVSAAVPGWTSAHKLSGITHCAWQLRYDTKGKKYTAGRPEPEWVGKWVKVYDPRLDSTYPGGSGACRSNDETTFVWSRNPALHALTWAIGRWQVHPTLGAKRTVGIGAPVSAIRVADFVEAANVADANGWGCGGVVWSTDSKWQTFKAMLQAGGAEPTMTGAMIGCRVLTPRISIATITRDHLMDRLEVSTVKPRRDRINSIIPRYRSESHDWQVVSGAPITVDAYVTADGGLRRRELDLPLVQAEVGQTGFNGDLHAGQLARYEIENAREAGPIRFTTGPQFIGLKCGDCVTLDVPEEGLSATKVMIVAPPQLDPATGKISFTAQTETDGKHSYALGTSTTPPPAFSLTPPDIVPTIPATGLWSLSAALGADGLPLLVVTAGAHTVEWDSVNVEYRKVGATDWTSAGSFPDDANGRRIEITAVDGGTAYEARVAYKSDGGISDWRTLSSATTPGTSLSNALIALGANQIVNSDWLASDAGFYGVHYWGGGGAPAPSYGRDLSGYGGNPRHALWSQLLSGSALPNSYFYGPGQLGFNGNIADLKLYGMPVTVNDTVAWGGRLAIHGGTTGYVRCRIFNAAGTMVQEWDAGGTQGDGRRGGPTGGQGDPANYKLWERIEKITATDAAYAVVACWMHTDAGPAFGDTDAYLFFTEPRLAKVAAGQTAFPPYTSGPAMRTADKTSENTAANVTNVGSTPATTVEAGGNKANNGLDSSGNVLTDKVSTDAIVDNNVTQMYSQATATSMSGNGGWQTLVSYTVTTDRPAALFLSAFVSLGYLSSARPWGIRIRVNGTVAVSRGGSAFNDAPSCAAKVDVPAATTTVDLQFYGADATVVSGAGQSSLIADRRYK